MTAARFFEAPEGRWTLAAEFSTEDAANQLHPPIARDVSGDDLCAGASGSDAHPAPSTPTAASLRFGTAGTAMVAGGFIFGGDPRPATSFPSAASSTAAATATGTGTQQPGQKGAAGAQQNNRPTFLAIVPTGDHATSLPPPLLLLPRSAEDVPASGSGGGGGGGGSSSSKSVVTKSSSSFVGRLVASDALARWALAPTPTLLFTAPRSLVWTTPPTPTAHTTLLRLDLLTSSALCCSAQSTSPGHMDVVAGFVRGHMLVYDAPGARYSRVNKASRWRPDIRCVAWVPGSQQQQQQQLFVAGAADGWLVLVDRSVEEFAAPGEAKNSSSSNPAACWRLSERALTSVSFAPQSTVAAVTSDDGHVYLVDVLAQGRVTGEKIAPFASSYFGALTCSAWSPCGLFLVCGGKDDLLGVWSAAGVLLARCHGHDSWVRAVAFDQYSGDSEGACRFVSAGDDGRVCVWELSLAALHRPRVGRAQVPVLLPLVGFRAHEAPVTDVKVAGDALVSACRKGTVRVWRRPEVQDDVAYV
ncbi:hypothetical protein LPJ53_000577 [Coemansia erecta]|uniref:WD40 repeat-like protein n=1 Tax=Coemansia erecta TaxID=147472 RepID=A0A9W8CVI3_9FUNG|nr:hypothetical protein LPJ53_000577 [Coemansia erecta]